MAAKEASCYVHVQLPGTFEWVPCASLKVRAVGSNAVQGTFTYGKRYLERQNVIALDPYHLPLSAKPLQFTKLKGIPGALRDASPDAWGRRIIQARLGPRLFLCEAMLPREAMPRRPVLQRRHHDA